MKKFFSVVLLLGALCAPSAFAWESWTTCYATTVCATPFGPMAISCNVSANSSGGVACTWFVQPGASVRCTGLGYDQFGRYGWVDLFDTCARFW